MILRGEHARKFCEPLIEFMRKNLEPFKSDEKRRKERGSNRRRVYNDVLQKD